MGRSQIDVLQFLKMFIPQQCANTILVADASRTTIAHRNPREVPVVLEVRDADPGNEESHAAVLKSIVDPPEQTLKTSMAVAELSDVRERSKSQPEPQCKIVPLATRGLELIISHVIKPRGSSKTTTNAPFTRRPGHQYPAPGIELPW